jgi:4-hydroxyphenylacetate 3-monooxygenase
LHGCTRLAVKLDFITGLMIKATETAGTRGFRGVEANIGEVITWRNAMWALSDAMAKSPDPWTDGFVLPGSEPGAAYHVLGPEAYVQVKHQIEKTVASSSSTSIRTPTTSKFPSCASTSTAMSAVPAASPRSSASS